MRATWGGMCPACWELIRTGDEIRRSPVTPSWIHDVCPEPIPEPQRDICPVCFTEREQS